MSGPFRVSWHLGTQDGKEIGTSEVRMLVAGGVCEVSNVWDLSHDLDPNEGGQVFVIVDSSGIVSESDEDNNSASCAVMAPDVIQPQGLVSHWTLDETTGKIARDSIGGNDGNVQGARWVGGRVGGALSFDGMDDYVDCEANPAMAPEKMTVAFWMFMEGRTSYQYVLGKAKNIFSEQDYTFSTGSDGKLEFAFGEDAGRRVAVQSKGALPLGQWVLVVATRDGATASLYLNTQLESSAAYSFVPSSKDQSLRIGSVGMPEPIGFFKGKIDDVRIYDKALSAEEIQALYKEVSP
jgi:hypothetical protein